MRPTLFISNGMGEDSMSAEIIRRVDSCLEAEAYPLIGAGRAFDNLCRIVGPRADVPSEGWRHTRWSVVRDLASISAIMPRAIGYLRRCRGRYDKVVVVGDTSAVILSVLAGLKVDLYIDVFKTGYSHRYTAVESQAIRRAVKKVFCRDDMLAAQLRDKGIDAVSHGNIMLDTVTYGDIAITGSKDDGISRVGLLPGSRTGTPQAFALQIDALEMIAKRANVIGVAAIADGIDIAALAQAGGLAYSPLPASHTHDMGHLSGRGIRIELYRGATGNVIEASDVVLSQAGTATQQALGLGKPVITFFPPEHRKKRMDDEQALMGESRLLLPPDPAAIAFETARLLEDPAERARLGAIGKQRLGGPGTLDAVIDELCRGDPADKRGTGHPK